MEFRKSEEKDINAIMNIIDQGKAYFKLKGIDQWQKGYPNTESIKNDVKYGNSYVLTENNIVIATVAVTFSHEKNYDIIVNGEWLSSGIYATIHRIAVHSDYKGSGMSSVMIQNIEKICLAKDIHSMRADTHKENLPMRKAMQKNKFYNCGIIYLEDGSERLAYEKII